MKSSFQKDWLSIEQQIDRLKTYGLIIADEASASEFLRHINYYRFSGFALAFEETRHSFYQNTSFEQIRDAYEYDRALRDLITESIEVIELDLRTSIAYVFAEAYTAFGHQSASNFYKHFRHGEWLQKLHDETDRSSELFIKHFKRSYTEYPNLPIWVATEVMSFGALSKMFGGMLKSDQKKISSHYRLQPDDLKSWIHHLVYVRNLCAHHSRIWDRVWSIKPDLPAGKVWGAPLLPSNGRLFATLLIQSTLLQYCPAEKKFSEQWRKRVETLIELQKPSSPDPMQKMGLTETWNNHPNWHSQ